MYIIMLSRYLFSIIENKIKKQKGVVVISTEMFMKKVISYILILTMLMTFLSINVSASGYSESYKSFYSLHASGMIYKPENYVKNKTDNQLFVEEFYENVFMPIKFSSLRPVNEIETNSMSQEWIDFFEQLNAGDILQIGETYSLYMSHSKTNVTLYDVDNPMAGQSAGKISYKSYDFSSFKSFTDYVVAFQPNGKTNYDILEEEEEKDLSEMDFEAIWGMKNIPDSNILKVKRNTFLDLSISYKYENGSIQSVNGDYHFTSSNPSVGIINGNTFKAQNVGTTTLSVRSKSGKYLTPKKELTIQVTSNSSDTGLPTYWDMPEIADNGNLYIKSNQTVNLNVMLKKNGVFTNVTGAMTYRTNDPNIIDIKNGKITALRSGEAILTAISQDGQIASPPDLIIKVDKSMTDDFLDTDTPNWKITGLNKNTLMLQLEEEASFKLFIYRNGKQIDVTSDFTFQLVNPTLATIRAQNIIAEKPGTTRLVANPKNADLLKPVDITITVLNEYIDPERNEDLIHDEENRDVSENAYYTFWRNIKSKNNTVTMYVGESTPIEVYLQNGFTTKDVTNKVSISTTDEEVAVVKGTNTLMAVGIGTTTLKGFSRGNFAPHPEDITIEVIAREDYSDDNVPIWTMDNIQSNILSINLSNYISKYITTGTISKTGINDTTNYMQFDTKDHNIAIVTRDGIIKPINVGVTKLYATSKYAEKFIPEPLTIEVYENKGEDGSVYIAIDGERPEVLRLSKDEKVPFEIYLEDATGNIEELTEEFASKMIVNGNCIQVKNGEIIGRQLGEASITFDVSGFNITPYELPVQVRVLDASIAEQGLFRDVSPGHWAYNYIVKLSKKKIINGFDDQTFKPGDNVTLEQAMKMIVLAKEKTKIEANGLAQNSTTAFIPEPTIGLVSDWAQEYVERGKEYIDTTGAFKYGFFGTDKATRIQIISLLSAMSNLENKGTANLAENFTDLRDIPSWSYATVELLASNGIVEGNENHQLKPNDNITRAELSKLIYKVFYEEHNNEEDDSIRYYDQDRDYSTNKNNPYYDEDYDIAPGSSKIPY